MNRKIKSLFGCFFLINSLMAGFCQEIDILTYNIRFDNPNDGVNQWDLRKGNLVKLLTVHGPDIFGIQEGLIHQVEYIDSVLADYSYIGAGRDDGKDAGEFCALFYKESEFIVLNQGIFWLSETPQMPSTGWDAALKRICVYGLFEHRKTRHRMLVLNTHLDHIGITAREKSTELIAAKARELNPKKIPVILLGDFNLEPGDKALDTILTDFEDALSTCSGEITGPTGTFNAFRFDLPVTQRIDYIFVSKGRSEIRKYAVIGDACKGRYPSDHLPVLVNVKLR
ncbi:MAG: endonuclease/exonuclease/phosphatase family protein [Bacteroidales bacterium]|nr:endonuclease/exonuclease/phosphatase family protein [Bacteroidales bacterium]